MLKEMKLHLKNAQARPIDTLGPLQKELKELETATYRLFETVEKGLLPMDDMLRDREQKNKARREAVLLEIAGTRRQKEMPVHADSSPA